jgi:hypothetical protein
LRKFAQLSSADAVYMANRGTTYNRKVSAPPLASTSDICFVLHEEIYTVTRTRLAGGFESRIYIQFFSILPLLASGAVLWLLLLLLGFFSIGCSSFCAARNP